MSFYTAHLNTDVLRGVFYFKNNHIKINVPYFFISLVKSFGVHITVWGRGRKVEGVGQEVGTFYDT